MNDYFSYKGCLVVVQHRRWMKKWGFTIHNHKRILPVEHYFPAYGDCVREAKEKIDS